MHIFITFYDDLGSFGEKTIITVDSLTELISTLKIMQSINCLRYFL